MCIQQTFHCKADLLHADRLRCGDWKRACFRPGPTNRRWSHGTITDMSSAAFVVLLSGVLTRLYVCFGCTGGGGGLSGGAIAGIVIGSIVGVLLLTALLVWLIKRRRVKCAFQTGPWSPGTKLSLGYCLMNLHCHSAVWNLFGLVVYTISPGS